MTTKTKKPNGRRSEPAARKRGRQGNLGIKVNGPRPEPRAPGGWVNEHECEGCGEKYEEFKVPRFDRMRFEDAYLAIKESTPYRSRGPILWEMRRQKLELWYHRHSMCDELLGTSAADYNRAMKGAKKLEAKEAAAMARRNRPKKGSDVPF